MTTTRARQENGTRAFERLLDATTTQTAVMTSMLEVQRQNKDAVNTSGDAIVALSGVVERQTVVLVAVKDELAAGPKRTADAVTEIKAHINSATKESDQRLYRWMLLAGITVFLGTSLGGGAVTIIQAWLKLPH